MILCFTLSMPTNNSWNGKWSGDEKFYAKTYCSRSKSFIEKAKAILAKESFSYNFGDGWTARIDVEEVDTKEATKIKRKSAGFCGYDWMVDSIVDNIEIRARSNNYT